MYMPTTAPRSVLFFILVLGINHNNNHNKFSCSAFVFSPTRRTSTSDTSRNWVLSLSAEPILEETITDVVVEIDPVYQDEEELVSEPVCLLTLTDMKFSKAIPFLKRPALLDGCMPGDVGFDPLDFVQSRKDLIRYREAEVKHGRLAMLAAAAWPLSDTLVKILNVDTASLFGGFNSYGIDIKFWLVIVTFGLVIELGGKRGRFPGDLGFDPLGLYPEDVEDQKDMELAEIKHGRLAMMAVVAYAFQMLFNL